MKETLTQLVDLQRIDARLTVLRRRLQSLPEEFGARESKQSVQEAEADALLAERKTALARAQDLDNDVREREQRIQKLEEQLRGTKDAGSVKIGQRELDELRSKISAAEDEALKLLERAEAMVVQHKTAMEKVKQGAQELAGFGETVAEDQRSLEGEIDSLESERKALCAKTDRAALEIYERLIPSRKGRPLAQLKGESCGGCGMVVPPNDRVKVLAQTSIARCKSCTRILVHSDIWSPETARAADGSSADA